MKNLRLSLFLCVCFLAMSVSMVSLGETMSNATTNDGVIDLNGSLLSGNARSLISPIAVSISGETVEVDFNATLGAINVSIYDKAGTVVYQQSVNASAGKQLLIDTSSFDSGDYTIEITNSTGQYLSGYFTI